MLEEYESNIMAEISICLVGNSKVGKSAIVSTFCQSVFKDEYVSTIGCDCDTRLFEVDGRFVKIHLHDLSGQESFLWSAKKHIENADSFIYCYDIMDHVTFEAIPKWMGLMNRHAKHRNLPKMLVGNKLDMRNKQQVTVAEAKEYGIPNNMKQIEMSAKSGQNLTAAFYILANDVLQFRRLGCFIPMGIKEESYQFQRTHVHEAPSTVSHCPDAGQDYVNVFRILLLGAVRTGKSAIRLRFCRNHYSPEYYASSGLEYSTRTVMVDGDKIRLQIWDVSGDGVYDTLRKSYYKGANAYMIVYDVTNKETFTHAEQLVKDLDMNERSECPKVVLGNKCDISQNRRAMSSQQAQEWSEGWRVPVVEASAKNGSNIEPAFYKLVLALKRQLAPWKRVYDFS